MTITIIIPYIACFILVFVALIIMYYVNKNTVESVTSKQKDLEFQLIGLAQRLYALERKTEKGE